MYVHSMDRSDSVRPNHGFKDYVREGGRWPRKSAVFPLSGERWSDKRTKTSARKKHWGEGENKIADGDKSAHECHYS